MSEVWGCASSFGRSPKREIGFVSFVRASGRGEAACLRERDYMLLYAGLLILEFSFASRLLRLWNIVCCIGFIIFSQ